MSAVDDRRQRAREAAQDAYAANHNALHVGEHAIDEAIRTSTQVKITDEAVEAFDDNRNGSTGAGDIRAGLAAALAALGFEVIE